ncbi:MAG: tetratricopeptide repeat protein [Bacteroidota bacterium]
MITLPSNKYRLQIIVLALLLFGTTLSLFAQKNKPLPEAQQIAFDQSFINANKYLMLKMPDEAWGEIQRALSILPESGAANYVAGKIAQQKGMLADAERYSKNATQAEPNNIWYHVQLAEVLKQQKKYYEAALVGEYIYLKISPTQERLYEATYLYVMAGKLDAALKLLNDGEKRFGIDEDIIRQKESIYLAKNQPKKAIAEVEKLTKAFPQNTRYMGMLADLYLTNKQEQKAVSLYQKILSIEPDNGFALLAIADYHRHKKEWNNWYEFTLRAVQSKNTDVKSKLKAIVDWITYPESIENKNERIFALANALTDANPGESAAFALLGDLYAREGKIEEAYLNYSKSVEIEPNNYNMWRQLIVCNNETKNHTRMLVDAEKAAQLFPTESIFYLYYSFSALQLKEYAKCIRMARLGVESIYENDLKVQLLIIMGDAAHYAKQYETCDSAYTQALELEPANVNALNNYAYFLSLRKIKLNEAEEMSKKCVQEEPNNASYLDTYGWILFVQKKYADALTYIQRAHHADPENAEVNEHLGDVLYFNNEIDRAILHWNKAKQLGSNSKILDKKIKDKKWYEE